jgi:hypothetical protein
MVFVCILDYGSRSHGWTLLIHDCRALNHGPVRLLLVIAGMGTVMGMQEMPTLSFERANRVIQNCLGRSKWEAIAVGLLPIALVSTRFFVHQLFYSIHRRARTDKSHP